MLSVITSCKIYYPDRLFKIDDEMLRVDVTNRFVYIFRGRSGARVITLTRENMNLIEVLALADGFPIAGKAYRVRVIRGNTRSPTVFDIDLSTVEGMKNANLTMVAND